LLTVTIIRLSNKFIILNIYDYDYEYYCDYDDDDDDDSDGGGMAMVVQKLCSTVASSLIAQTT